MVASKWLLFGCASIALFSVSAQAQAPAAADEIAKTDGPITQAADIVVIVVFEEQHRASRTRATIFCVLSVACVDEVTSSPPSSVGTHSVVWHSR